MVLALKKGFDKIYKDAPAVSENLLRIVSK